MGLNGGGQRLKSRSSAPKSSLIFTPDEACWIPKVLCTRTQHEALTQAAAAFGGVFLHRPAERHIHHFSGPVVSRDRSESSIICAQSARRISYQLIPRALSPGCTSRRSIVRILHLRLHLSCDDQARMPIGLRLDSLTPGSTLLHITYWTQHRVRFFSSLIVTIRLLAADGIADTMEHSGLAWTWFETPRQI
jgi:hypothetical protein